MPGKFEGNADEKLAEALHVASLDGTDEATGNDDGWYGLLHSGTAEDPLIPAGTYILHENSQGFFTYEQYEYRSAQSRKDWEAICNDVH